MTTLGDSKGRLVVNLNNRVCPYCAEGLRSDDTTEDHVIARLLVPKGSLEQSWNLHIRACSDCNSYKAALEDRVSAASMHRPLVGVREPDDVTLAREAARKRQGSAGPRGDRSNQKVKHETELMPGVRKTFDLVAPPSVDPQDVLELAWLHVSALFYHHTFDAESQTGASLPGVFSGVQWSPRSDWGNERHRGFMGCVSDWGHRINIDAARGCFKAIIRHHPSSDSWAWAVEWNRSYRAVGFFGDESVVVKLTEAIPLLVITPVGEPDGGVVGVRVERPLAIADDLLFSVPTNRSAGYQAVAADGARWHAERAATEPRSLI